MLRKDLGLLVLILVVGAVVALINPRFLSPVNLANTANLIGLFGIFSLGEGLVIITGGIDLSIGSVFALLGVIFVDLLVTYELPWPLAVVIILVAGPLVGLINGFLITRMRLQPFVVTLCGLLLYRGIARYYTNDGTAGFAFGQSFPTLEWLTTGRSFGVPHTFIAFVIIALAMAVLLHRSVFGRYLFAVGRNEEAARYSGIQTGRVVTAAYVICGALAKLAFLGGATAVAGVHSLHESGALSVSWARPAAVLVASAWNLAALLMRAAPPTWLYVGIAICAVLYAVLFGLGAAVYRTLYLQPINGR